MAKMELSIANFMSQLIKNRQIQALREIFEAFNEVDMASVVEELPVADAFFLFKILPKETSGEIFSYLSEEAQEEYVKLWTGPELTEILQNVYASDIVDFIDDMPSDIVDKVLKAADPQTRSEINMLLSYAESSCGSIMSTDYMSLSDNLTIGQSMNELRKRGRYAENNNICYVVDERKKLVGFITLKKILFAANSKLLKDEMDTEIISVQTNQDQEDAVDMMQKYDLLMIPVVDSEQRLLGVITSDDALDVMEEEATEDMQIMAAITPTDTSYLETNTFKLAKSRLPWLLILMLSASISSWIMGRNTLLLTLYPVLSSFVPMLMDTAGNAGSQSSTMVVRGITTDDMTIKDIGKVIRKELCVAAICGAVLFGVNMARIAVVMPNVSFAINLSVSLTVFVVVVLAKMIGGVLPLLASALKMDPAVIASPLITTLVDATSLTTFFLLVSTLL